jgi:predicted nucleic-acid-binding Zn-ribbon protein
MNKAVECVRCHARMELGFMIDGHQNGHAQEIWSPGEPKESFWTGLKLEKDKLIPVTTLRCPVCGYMESYAVREVAPGE